MAQQKRSTRKAMTCRSRRSTPALGVPNVWADHEEAMADVARLFNSAGEQVRLARDPREHARTRVVAMRHATLIAGLAAERARQALEKLYV